MSKLNTGFTNLTDDELYHLGLNVSTDVAPIPVFSRFVSQLPAITTAANALQTAMNLPAGPVRETSVAAARKALSTLLTNLANGLMTVPNVPDTALAASGFTLRHAATHSSLPPDAPAKLHLKTTGVSGELSVLIDAVARAVMYDVEWTLDPVNGPWTDAGSYNSTRGIKLTGLTRGTDYYVHVRAVATGQNRGP